MKNYTSKSNYRTPRLSNNKAIQSDSEGDTPRNGLNMSHLTTKMTSKYGGGTPSIMPAVHTPMQSVTSPLSLNRKMVLPPRRGPTPLILSGNKPRYLEPLKRTMRVMLLDEREHDYLKDKIIQN